MNDSFPQSTLLPRLTPIRVLIVEDSQIALVLLKRILDASPRVEVVGTARTGLEALSLIPTVDPDVICTDLHMPHMNGLEFTHEVMTRYPRPILVVSASVQADDTHHIFQVLEAGAVDIFPKPVAGLIADDQQFNQQLIDRIEILSGVKVFTKRRKPSLQSAHLSGNDRAGYRVNSAFKPEIVGIGASTGGPQALQELLSQLPANFPLPIICVQHICSGFLQGLINWLASSCPLPIQIAQPGERPEPGQVYFPPERKHLGLDAQGRFKCHYLPAVDGHRPSVTVTFQSIAQFYGNHTVGILLTGMGRDGADGMQAIAESGGYTIAQDEATSVVFGMPREAIKLGAVQRVLPIQTIAPTLLTLIQAALAQRSE
ncbi:chemotaxis-specific protein-glutamate methyltransferase CheB [Egbenema bharatensis]|uniref:chemotaxis-specific protein-glutamate methyltransferase CheB n=1 Tax=Egbenema bharatensis TaxID=3463334 RepID=UPI003A8429FB